ncbi:MAG TPA: hypothetical protein PLV68_16025, partial [Ilumatobacteraceae bacterium]|nr:hypothetical protein [Ilumatobacteraceae bacterium]
KYPDRSLSSLYEPDAMPKDLVAAHDQVDEVIDGLFGAVQDISEDDRQRLLFRMYGEMAGKKPSTAGARRR